MSELKMEHAVSPSAPEAQERALSRASILLVDDQPGRLISYEAILATLEVSCVRAMSGRDALQRLLEQEFAVILLDVRMPEMDGFEVARLIRGHPRIERTPIIFVTADQPNEMDRLRGYESGAVDFINLPIVPEILRSKVAVLLELHQRRSELQALAEQLAQARAQAEAQHAATLAEREALLRATFEHPTEMMLLLEAKRDAGGRIADWIYRNANARSLELLGLARADLIGRCIGEVLPERADALRQMCTRVLETHETYRYEARFVERDFLITVFPLGSEAVVSSALDITERKRTEAALRESERRQRALIHNAPVGVAYNALDGRFEYANKAFCEIVGYEPDELLSKTWQDITHPDDLPADLALGRRVLSGEITHYTIDKRYVRKNGTEVWVNLFGNFVLDEHDQPTQGVGIAIDISERRRVLAELRQSRERLLLAKTASGLGTFDWDLGADAIRWDERTHELWGTDPNDPVSYDVFEAGLHPDDRAMVLDVVRRSIDPAMDGTYHVTYRVVNRRDGRTRWIEASGKVHFRDGKPVRMVGVVFDVTERALGEEKLRAGEQRFRELANTIDQFAWICDNEGRRSWYNDRWYQYSGTTFEHAQGFGWKALHHPEHIERVLVHLGECLRSGKSWEDTFPLRGKDGCYRWFLSRAVPIRDDTGNVVRWFGTNTDITEQRQLQEALEHADRRKDEFLAMLAHELRNPVAPIASAAEVLTRLLEDGKQRAMADIIRRQAGQLGRLLDDLLDVARITQGRVELRRAPTTLQSCIDLAVETAEPLIRERGHRLTALPAGQALSLHADQARIAQCIANLLGNAAKYTEPGGEIRVRQYAADGYAALEVSDTGIGIAPKFLPHMFELFAQSERGLDRAQGGLGIGLSVCKRLIEMHGGAVTAHSAGLGAGATFTIRLPLAAAALAHAAPMHAHAPSRSALRVLIVDDNHDAAHSLSLLLDVGGHRTLAVNSGNEALQVAPTFDAQLVLLDIGLPDMSGYDVAARLRTLLPAARLVAISGYGQAEDRRRSAQAGFHAHLVKPLEIAELEKILSA